MVDMNEDTQTSRQTSPRRREEEEKSKTKGRKMMIEWKDNHNLWAGGTLLLVGERVKVKLIMRTIMIVNE
jgi:hypothetical protein